MIKQIRLVTTLLLLSTSSAQAYTLIHAENRNLTTTGWKTDQVTFDIDTSCNDYTADVTSSLKLAQDLWNHTPTSSLSIQIGPTVTLPAAITTYVGSSATQYAPVGNPIVYCDTNFQTNSGQDASRIPGFAASHNMLPSGQLQGALLVLNFQAGARANLHDLGPNSASIILAHEIGHVLGLGHSSDTHALMYFSTNSSRNLILSQDDIDGISYLYPRDEPGHGGLMGCASIAAVKGLGGKEKDQKRPPGLPTGAAEFCLLLAFAAVTCQLMKSRPCY